MKNKSKKKKKPRQVSDCKKAIRKDMPKVPKSIDKLVDKFLASDDYVKFHKRFDRG